MNKIFLKDHKTKQNKQNASATKEEDINEIARKRLKKLRDESDTRRGGFSLCKVSPPIAINYRRQGSQHTFDFRLSIGKFRFLR